MKLVQFQHLVHAKSNIDLMITWELVNNKSLELQNQRFCLLLFCYKNISFIWVAE